MQPRIEEGGTHRGGNDLPRSLFSQSRPGRPIPATQTVAVGCPLQPEVHMFADPAILKQSKDNLKLDRQVYQDAARRSGSVLLVSTNREETLQASLLEYAAFVV